MGNYHEDDTAHADTTDRYYLFWRSGLERNALTPTGLAEIFPDAFSRPRPIWKILGPYLASFATRVRGGVLTGLVAGVMLALVHGSADARSGPHQPGWTNETGVASFYGRSHRGRRTASGKRFDDAALTAAHPWLPFGTKVRVTVLATGRSVIVTITDRLPARRRIVDLSLAAARLLGIVGQGIATVSLEPVVL